MQIIRYAKEQKWFGTCPACGCAFVYNGGDIQVEKYVDFYGITSIPREPANADDRPVTFVTCPECRYKVKIPTMARYRRPAGCCGEEDGWDE